ncbi:hypothetical protein MCEMSE15_00570 [Fimbriimonadaceae bacterium]|jgi:hypothetical protein
MQNLEKQQFEIRLTPEQLEAVFLADQYFESGESFTAAQVREMARKRTEAWLNIPQTESE